MAKKISASSSSFFKIRSTDQYKNLNNIIYIFLIVLSVFLTYCQVYSFTFLYDDEFFIQKNEFLNSFSNIWKIFTSSTTAGAGFKDSFYRPLQMFFYLLIKQTVGEEIWAFHFLNVLIHSANAVLVYTLAKRFRLSHLLAFFVALAWGVHPIHTECVAYMSATADLLFSFFVLLGMIVMAPQFSFSRLFIGWILFCLGLLSKETAVVFPALMVSVIFFFSEQRWHWRPYLKTAPFWLTVGVYFILRSTALNFNGDFSFYKNENILTQSIYLRTLTFLSTLPEYLRLLLWPEGLHIDRQFPVQTTLMSTPVILGLVMALMAVGILIFSFMGRKSKRVFLAWMVLWFAAAHAPHAGVLLPMNSLFLEHWMYLPSLAFFMGLGTGLQYLLSGQARQIRYAFGALASLVCICLGVASFQQSAVWKDAKTLFTHILEHSPRIARARHNLAMIYSDEKNYEKALEQYQMVLEIESYPQTYHNMGRIYAEQNKLDLAEASFLKAIELASDFFPSYGALVQLYEFKGDAQKAAEYKKKFDALREGR